MTLALEDLCPHCGDGVSSEERGEIDNEALDFARGEVPRPVCGDQLERV